jgi:hypothetical protein
MCPQVLKRPISLALITAALTAACAPAPPAPTATPACTDGTTADRYFPSGAFVPEAVNLDKEVREGLANALVAANEIPWTCGAVPTEGYRLLVAGRYGLPSIVVSVGRTSSGWRTAVTEFEALTPETVNVARRRSGNEIASWSSGDLRQALQRASFWSGPTWQDIQGTEGDIVMIEVIDRGDHRAVVQAIPSAEFRNAASIILRLATGSDEFLQLRERPQ